jgi:hypothetical protein
MTGTNLTVATPISITYGCVRIATVSTWADACALLHGQIADDYRPNGRMSSPNQVALAHEAHELAQVAAGPQSGMIVTSGTWAWGDSIRAARAGEHGLTAGDLAYVHDFPNGYSTWTIDAKAKILAVNADTRRVTLRITDQSAVQFAPGESVVVHATRIRPRQIGRR